MTLLQTRALAAFYGDFQALFDIDVTVEEGETVAIIGANGAGKTTFLRALAGALPCGADMVRFEGRAIGAMTAHEIVRLGIAMVPEGRRLFPSLTVEENLKLGAHSGRAGTWTLDRVYELFPMLAEHRGRPATLLSGGQQQMAAIGRALMSNPRLLLCDELSLGLAPVVVRRIYGMLPQILATGLTVLLVEQDVSQALRVASHLQCLLEGHTTLEAVPSAVTADQVEAAYFGLALSPRAGEDSLPGGPVPPDPPWASSRSRGDAIPPDPPGSEALWPGSTRSSRAS